MTNGQPQTLRPVWVDGLPTEVALKVLARQGPPFIFACLDKVLEIGERFMVGEQVFAVTRLVTRDEYVVRMAEVGGRAEPGWCACYFEATAD